MRRVLLVALCLTGLALLALVTLAGTTDDGRAAGPRDAVTAAAAPAPEPATAPGDASTEEASATEEHDQDDAVPPAGDGHGSDRDGSAAAHARASVPLPVCRLADEPTPASGYDDWRVSLLDTIFMLPPEYEPPDLVPVATAFPPEAAGHAPGLMRAVVVDDLRALVADAAAQGLALAVQSAYRSYQYQLDTFQYWVDRQGFESAAATSARAGHSEHQLGTAFDLRSAAGPAAWDLDDWATTPEGAWVAANAWRYGFVMSYPSGAAERTCYAYEPWHYRYVGRELAAVIHADGRAPREVLWDLATGALP